MKSQPGVPAEPFQVEDDPLLAFASEHASQPVVRSRSVPANAAPERPSVLLRAIAAIMAALGLAICGALYLEGRVGARGADVGTLSVETDPAGADVTVDGQTWGSTPLAISLPAGPHAVVVRHGADERQFRLTLAAGAEVVHHLEFNTVTPGGTLGGMSVVTDPPGARVLIDGEPRGESPVTLNDLQATAHIVSVTTDAGTANQTIAVRAGETVPVLFSLPKAPRPASKLTLAAGDEASARHDAPPVGVDALAGKNPTTQVDTPKGELSVNARPWADVFIAGENVGQTPIANLSVPAGTYEVVFRNPELGEVRQTVTVIANSTNRVAVDLTK